MNAADRLRQLSVTQVIVFGLMLAGFYYLVGYDSGANLQAQIEANRAAIKDLQSKVSEEEKKLARIEQYRKATASMGESFQTLLTFIPAKLAAYDLLKTVSNEAKAANTSIANLVESGQPTRSGFYTELSIRVDLNGTFQQMMLFLSFLTRSDQFMTVHNLTLTGDATRMSKDNPSLRLSAEIHGYRYEQEAPKE